MNTKRFLLPPFYDCQIVKFLPVVWGSSVPHLSVLNILSFYCRQEQIFTQKTLVNRLPQERKSPRRAKPVTFSSLERSRRHDLQPDFFCMFWVFFLRFSLEFLSVCIKKILCTWSLDGWTPREGHPGPPIPCTRNIWNHPLSINPPVGGRLVGPAGEVTLVASS